jgi:hypothetical protein
MAELPPLTHHEILALAEPFVRRGRAVDLPASDRAARRIAFRAFDHAAGALPALHETLALDAPAAAGRLRLTRRLDAGDGLVAVLEAEGDDAGALLEAVEAVPPARQFVAESGALLALDQRIGRDGLVLRQAAARCGALRLHARVSSVSGYPAELKLQRIAGAAHAPAKLPDDLFAVLGRHWSLLDDVAGAWQAHIGLRGREPERSAQAEQRLARTLRHLAETLAAPPARFHRRHLGARWLVSLRRMAPLSVGLAVIGLGLWARDAGEQWNALLAALANLAPPLLMGLFFLRREMPRIEFPRIPLPPRASAWTAEKP